MLITQERRTISQNTASIPLLDTAVLLHLNKLLSQLPMDHNQLVVLQLSIQLTIWLPNLKREQLHCLISTHGQGITGSLQILMLITQEKRTISQSIASTALLVTAVSPHQNRLPNQPFTDLNQLVDTLLSTQLTTWLFKLMLKRKPLHCPTSTHGQEITGSLLILMLTIPERKTIFQSTASTTLPATAVSPHPNKLPNQPFMDHNQLVDMQLSIQLTTWSSKLMSKPLHCQTSTHGQETTGNQLILMPITQEKRMISQNTASTQLLATAVLPHQNKLLNQPSMAHSQVVISLSSIQLTTWLPKLVKKDLYMFHTHMQDLKISTWLNWNTAQIWMRDSLLSMERLRLLHIQPQDSTAMLTMACERIRWFENERTGYFNR